MSIQDRLYGIAKGQLDRALQRWSEIDSRAQQEIDDFMANHSDTNSQSAWDRAVGKINAATAQRDLVPASQTVAEPPSPVVEANLDALEASIAAERAATAIPRPPVPPAQTLEAAYRMLGVAPNADWLTVQKSYRQLRERAAPERFPEGSAERSTARDIQRRIDSAYMMLSSNLAPANDRFDRLEI